MDEPPWEWVNGDTVYAAPYGFIRGVLLGRAIGLAAAQKPSFCLTTIIVVRPGWFSRRKTRIRLIELGNP